MSEIKIPAPDHTSPKKTFVVSSAAVTGLVKSKIIKLNIDPLQSDQPLPVKSMLGTPVYTQVVLKESKDTIVGPEASGVGYIKFDTCLVTVTQDRNIIKTPIQGRNGTVKEYIADGDYEIGIQGQIVSKYSNVLPGTDIDYMHKLFVEPNEIIIESDFVALFGITYCVVEHYKIWQIEGSRNSIGIEIRLCSDDPIEVKLGIAPDQ